MFLLLTCSPIHVMLVGLCELKEQLHVLGLT
jgi:hypothetical protein